MPWKAQLAELLSKKAFVLGVGNELRGDDGVGPAIIKRLEYENKFDAGVMPENYLFKLKKLALKAGFTVIIVVDAVDFGGKPGEIKLLKASEASNPNISTHSLSLSIFAKFFPKMEVWLLGIQPKNNSFGEGLSKEVEEAVKEILKAF